MDENSQLINPIIRNAPKRPIKKSRAVVIVVFLFIVVGSLVFGGKSYIDSQNQKQAQGALDDIQTPQKEFEIQFPTDPPVSDIPDRSSDSEITNSPVPSPAVDPVDTSTGLDRSKLSIKVQNGSGVTGAANKASDVLKGLGYSISSFGNADNPDYTDVVIKIKSDKSDYLSLLKKDLGFSYTIGSTSADLDDSFSEDALVIIGK